MYNIVYRLIDILFYKSSLVRGEITSVVTGYLRNNNDSLVKFLSQFKAILIKELENYPSIFNDGYRHIEKVIELVSFFSLNIKNSIIDVGSADGTISIKFSKAFPEAKIYSFEPIKKTFEKLSNNTKNYPNISIMNVALGSKTQKMNMHIAERITSSSLFEINEHIDDEYLDANIKKKSKEEIEIKRLDEILLEEEEIFNIMKIDVQGYELEVLKGSIGLLNRVKIIVLEMQNHDSYVKAPQYYELDAFLRNHNFQLFDIIPSIRKRKQLYEWDGVYVNNILLKNDYTVYNN